MKYSLILILVLFLFQYHYIDCDAVCTQTTLLAELVQDINDNGKLDCLRVPLPKPTNRAETTKERKLRLEAPWDTDCSFEADYDWLKPLKENYGLKTGLVDKDGNPVDNDFDDQADMCEIFRALIAAGKIEGAKISDLSASAADGIECPGDAGKGQSQVCAVTAGGHGQKYTWYILLDGTGLAFSNKPRWKLTTKSTDKINHS